MTERSRDTKISEGKKRRTRKSEVRVQKHTVMCQNSASIHTNTGLLLFPTCVLAQCAFLDTKDAYTSRMEWNRGFSREGFALECTKRKIVWKAFQGKELS